VTPTLSFISMPKYRCKFIHSLEHDGRTLSSEASKKEALFSFFDKILGVS
jgi:hypothetical protein